MSNKKLEISDFLRHHQIDVAFLTETHLKPNTNLSLPDHAIVRLDRTKTQKGGGVAIAIKRGLQFRMLPDLRLSTIEAVGVELSSPEGPITMIAIYCPTQSKESDGTAVQFKNDLQKLTRRRGKFILAGDLNARHATWGNQRNNRNGAVLAEDLQAGHYVVLHPDSPTFYSPAGVGSTLDVTLTNMADACSAHRVITDLSSDHLPVVFEVDQSIEQRQQLSRRNYHRAKWPQLQRFVEDRVAENPALETTDDIDRVLQALSDDIDEAEQQFIPSTPMTCKFTNLDDMTKRIISLRNCIRRQFQRTQNVARKVLYKKLNKIIAKRVEKLRNRQFSKELRSLPNYSRPFWRLTKVLKTKPKPIPPLRIANEVYITPTEKANSISEHFMASHNLGRDMVSPMEASVSESVSQLAAAPSELPEEHKITLDELVNAIKSTKNMKAPGFDGLFNIVLKKLGPKAYTLLVNVFNRCLELGYFPSAWKRSKVVPILKPGKDPTSPSSYRPISLLSSLSKLFEKLLYARLLEHTNSNDILLEEQFGFRRGHSTVDQLKRVSNLVSQAKSVSKTTVMALLDIEKAFDNVWHNGLVHKLLRFRFPVYLVKVISNYLDGRTSQVCVGSAHSEPYEVPAGVPQGSILGPLLYNLYTSDIPPLPDGGTLSLFADDSAISYKGRVIRTLVSKLQKGLDVYTSYLSDWKICVNAAKTQTIVFPHRNTDRLKPTSKINILNAEIDWSSDVRYLGLLFDSKFLFRQHVEDRINKGTIMLKRLYPIINRRSKASTVNKLAVYKQIVAPMLEYGCPVWKGCAQTHRKKLQVLQNKFLKMALNLPVRTRTAEVHRLANLDPLDIRLATLARKHEARASNSEFQQIRNLYP